MRISTPQELETFVTQVGLSIKMRNNTASLYIDMPTMPLPVNAVRTCLQLLPNLSDLLLVVVPSSLVTILHGINLKRLRLFKTNLPHISITSFIARTPSIRYLMLGCCGRQSPCSLKHLDLEHVVHITGPVACVCGIVGTRVSRLSIERCRNPLCTKPNPALAFPISLNLVTLHIDFAADNYQFMRAIVESAPNVRRLKLVEYTNATVRSLVL